MSGGTGDNAGILPRTVEFLFTELERNQVLGSKYEVHLSCLEMYNENLFDLLGDVQTAIKIKEVKSDPSHIDGLSITKIGNREELYSLLTLAINRRKTSSTLNNVSSSRSHFLAQITITNFVPNEIITSRINLIDLAGSESGKNTTCMLETTNINTSLLELKKVLISLKKNSSFVNYRDSILTRILKPHLCGTSKVLMFVNVSVLQKNSKETLNALRFAVDVNQTAIKPTTRNIQK